VTDKKKIAIVGAGIGGVVTALSLNFYGQEVGLFDICDRKIDIYYDPSQPIERVGQGAVLNFNRLLVSALNCDWIDNKIGAVPKTGAYYEGWGKSGKDLYHYFPMGSVAFHYQPNLVSKAVLNCGLFNVIEKDVDDIDDIQADYIFDCRGRKYNSYDAYEDLINPLNAALISRKSGRDYNLHYTRCVATPDGWTFVIPNLDSVSYGYLYNHTITDKEIAISNFKNIFDVDVDFDLQFRNYVAKNVWDSDRVILNGNRFAFIEPLEASSIGLYLLVATNFIRHMLGAQDKEEMNEECRQHVKDVESFILWHYQNGSKYDTPFWDYAKSLPFNPTDKFKYFLNYSTTIECIDTIGQMAASDLYDGSIGEYGQWTPYSFKMWYDYAVKDY
jgi:tryptophan halogenase